MDRDSKPIYQKPIYQKPITMEITSKIIASLNFVIAPTQGLLDKINSYSSLNNHSVEFSRAKLTPSKKGLKLQLYGATLQGSGSKQRIKVKTPKGHTGDVYILKDILCGAILEQIYRSSYFAKKTLTKPESITIDDFKKCLESILKGFFYTLVQVDEKTIEVWFPTEKLHHSLYFQKKIESLKVESLFKRGASLPEAPSIPDMVEIFERVFSDIKFHYMEFSEGQFLILNMWKKPDSPFQGTRCLSFSELNRRYPIIECEMCCEPFVWKNPITSCCGGHARCCIRCINSAIQSALDNTSAAQLSVRCQFGCDKALIDFSDGKVVILSVFKPVLNKDTNSKINAVALRLKETVDDSLKEAMRAEALSKLVSLRKEAEEADPNSNIRENTNFCPKCFASILRTSGCNAMNCSACGTPLCIKCGTFDTTTGRCQCTPSITVAYFHLRLPEGLLTTRFEIREDPPSQS